MVGVDIPEDADRLKKLLESPTRHGKAVVPTLLAGTRNVDAPKQIKRSSKSFDRLGRIVHQKARRTSVHRTRSHAPPSTPGGGATMKRTSAGKTHPPLERLDLRISDTAVRRWELLKAMLFRRRNYHRPPKTSSNCLHLITNYPDLPTFDIRVKKSSAASRSLGSYVTATKTLAPPPGHRNDATMKRGSITSTKDLPPPPYQRQSSLVKATKGSKGTTKRKNSVVNSSNDEGSASFDNDVYVASSRTVNKAPRRRYISESEMADDFYVDDFDWLEAMTSDVKKAFAMAKVHESDPIEIMDAQSMLLEAQERYLWIRFR
jgi:hypothetical protein